MWCRSQSVVCEAMLSTACNSAQSCEPSIGVRKFLHEGGAGIFIKETRRLRPPASRVQPCRLHSGPASVVECAACYSWLSSSRSLPWSGRTASLAGSLQSLGAPGFASASRSIPRLQIAPPGRRWNGVSGRTQTIGCAVHFRARLCRPRWMWLDQRGTAGRHRRCASGKTHHRQLLAGCIIGTFRPEHLAASCAWHVRAAGSIDLARGQLRLPQHLLQAGCGAQPPCQGRSDRRHRLSPWRRT